MRSVWRCRCIFGVLAGLICLAAPSSVYAQTKIVAIGASNTLGFGAGFGQSYPSQLDVMLKAHGYKVQMINAGVLADTTRGMLARIDSSVPSDTRIVILQPGGNDVRFGIPKEERANNIRLMVARLQKRGIHVIVADDLQGLLAQHSADGIHFNSEAHTIIAKKLYPEVVSALGGAPDNTSGLPQQALTAGGKGTPAPAPAGTAH
jgi:acyl-CoA thioesterase-1